MKIDVKHIAKLANLPLSQKEEEKYAKQLSQILDYMEKLNQADTLGVEPTFNPSTPSIELRTSSLRASATREDETEACLTHKKGYYKTKGVFND